MKNFFFVLLTIFSLNNIFAQRIDGNEVDGIGWGNLFHPNTDPAQPLIDLISHDEVNHTIDFRVRWGYGRPYWANPFPLVTEKNNTIKTVEQNF